MNAFPYSQSRNRFNVTSYERLISATYHLHDLKPRKQLDYSPTGANSRGFRLRLRRAVFRSGRAVPVAAADRPHQQTTKFPASLKASYKHRLALSTYRLLVPEFLFV